MAIHAYASKAHVYVLKMSIHVSISSTCVGNFSTFNGKTCNDRVAIIRNVIQFHI